MKSYSKKGISIQEDNFQKQLHDCRDAFEKAKIITPSLVVIELQDATIPCYIDQLDNGMELMFFPNESSFTYSIMNSMQEDPDLLFTNAWTIDFLYQPCLDSDLYVSEGKNLCFRNLPGCLPKAISSYDMPFLTTCLQQITHTFQSIHLPCLMDHKMVKIKNFQSHEEDFQPQENMYTLTYSDKDMLLFKRLPHTNEEFTLSLIALPYKDSEYTKKLHIRFIAQTKHNQKEMDITLDSMEEIITQLHPFFIILFKERGIPEAFYVHNKNIANMLAPLCESLNIVCIVSDASCSLGDFMLQMIMDRLQMDNQVQEEKKEVISYSPQAIYSSMEKRKVFN